MQSLRSPQEPQRLLILTPLDPNVSSAIPAGSEKAKLASLAKIQIPTFDRDWLDWPRFKCLFESLIHNDTDLPKVLKLQHLLAHLSGEATELLENTEISDEG